MLAVRLGRVILPRMASTKTPSQDDDDRPAPSLLQSIPLDDRQVRLLRIAVIVMGVVLVCGLIAVIARIGYLATRSSPGTAYSSGAVTPQMTAALPAGASIRMMALSGDRLALHYDAPSGTGIAVLDLATGRTLSRITIVPEAPR